MNILHIDTEKYWRGGQQQVLYLHQGLTKRNINSLLVCSKSSELKNRCEKNNLPYFEITVFGEIDLFAAYRISRVCKRNNIDIIQAHSAHAVTIGLLIKVFLPKLKLIAVRRVDFSVNKNFVSKFKYTNNKIDKIICISEFIKSVLIKDGINESKLITIRSGVDINKFDGAEVPQDFRENLGVLKDEILIGTVAALAGHKDFPNLLKAFSIVVSKHKNVKLCIVGDGPMRDEITNIINELGITERVLLLGYREDVGKYLKSLDIFVLASKKEGLGTSVIDALAVGLPVVATKAGGIPEIIKNDYNGILVETGNPQMLADGILELVMNHTSRKQFSSTAVSSVAKFSIKNTIDQNVFEYEKLLGKKIDG